MTLLGGGARAAYGSAAVDVAGRQWEAPTGRPAAPGHPADGPHPEKASQRLFDHAQVAATPMTGWGPGGAALLAAASVLLLGAVAGGLLAPAHRADGHTDAGADGYTDAGATRTPPPCDSESVGVPHPDPRPLSDPPNNVHAVDRQPEEAP